MKKCVREEIDLINTYDQYVDIVSCWESFFEHSFKMEYPSFFFDRFPEIPLKSKDKSLTPDFTAFFNEKYGMIFEISRTYPIGNKKLNKEMIQLFEYDKDIPLFNGKKHIEVDNYDIVLLLGAKDSFEIAQRISKYLEKQDKKFNHNFIVIEYNSNYMDTHPYYYFRKIPMVKSTFTDFFPEHISIFKQVDKNFKSIKVKIEYMKEYKINGVLCNDNPRPAYLAGYIWHKILYNYMSEEKRQLWREKNPRIIIPIELDIEDLKLRVEKSIRNGKIRRSWIKNVLEFLVNCDLAERKSEDMYEVRYRNLYPKLESEYRNEFLLEREYTKELSRFFIERFCGKKFEKEEKEENQRQKSLIDFL